MKSVLLMVLMIVLAIPLFATPVQPESGTNYLRISINAGEEVVSDFVKITAYEILAIKPAELKQNWLPSDSNNGRLYAKADINTRFRKNNIPIKKGRHRQSGFK